MAKYYYKKYKALPRYYKRNERSYTTRTFSAAEAAIDPWFYVDPELRLIIDETQGYRLNREGTVYHTALTQSMRGYIIHDPSRATMYAPKTLNTTGINGRFYKEFVITPTWVRGDYMGEVVGEDGQYPADGYDPTTKFYYVKYRTLTLFCAHKAGVWQQAASHVMVNGVWQNVYVYPRIDGVWIK